MNNGFHRTLLMVLLVTICAAGLSGCGQRKYTEEDKKKIDDEMRNPSGRKNEPGR
jgi:hypothetical protein